MPGWLRTQRRIPIWTAAAAALVLVTGVGSAAAGAASGPGAAGPWRITTLAGGVGGQGFNHGRIGEPFAVKLNQVAPLRDKSLLLETPAGGIADLAGQLTRATPRRQPRQGVDQQRADATTREFRIDIEHVDDIGALQAAKASRFA